MRMIDLIAKKRDGKTLTAEEFDFIAQGAAKGTVPDYQLSAFLMACFLRPLSDKETALFTKAMAHSGGRLDFSDVKLPKTDKHSTVFRRGFQDFPTCNRFRRTEFPLR